MILTNNNSNDIIYSHIDITINIRNLLLITFIIVVIHNDTDNDVMCVHVESASVPAHWRASLQGVPFQVRYGFKQIIIIMRMIMIIITDSEKPKTNKHRNNTITITNIHKTSQVRLLLWFQQPRVSTLHKPSVIAQLHM